MLTAVFFFISLYVFDFKKVLMLYFLYLLAGLNCVQTRDQQTGLAFTKAMAKSKHEHRASCKNLMSWQEIPW